MLSHASKHEEKQIYSVCERLFEKKTFKSVNHFCRIFAIIPNISISFIEGRITPFNTASYGVGRKFSSTLSPVLDS